MLVKLTNRLPPRPPPPTLHYLSSVGVFSKLTNSCVPPPAETRPDVLLKAPLADIIVSSSSLLLAFPRSSPGPSCSYCLTAVGGSVNFYSHFEAELQDVIPIVNTTIGGTRIIGRLCAGQYNARFSMSSSPGAVTGHAWGRTVLELASESTQLGRDAGKGPASGVAGHRLKVATSALNEG